MRKIGSVPILLLGLVSLFFGVAGGLGRLAAGWELPAPALAFHGPLMVSAFFGAVISLERAAALARPWGYAAPLGAALGGVLVIGGLVVAGFVLMALAAAVFVAASLSLHLKQPTLESTTLLVGAAAWLAGNLALLLGEPSVPWWAAFFVLTIGGERLELSRYLRRGPWVRRSFAGLMVLAALMPFWPRLLGAVLVLLALWLLAFDLARVTIRQEKLPRYVAACLRPGYAWLGLGGALMAAAMAYDAAMHAIFVGFVLSMVFGHAPVILPAVLRVRYPYHRMLYAPLALLHASLAVRVAGGLAEDFVLLRVGAWGNALAIALFIAVSAVLVLGGKPGPSRKPS